MFFPVCVYLLIVACE